MKFLKKYNVKRIVWLFIAIIVMLFICYAAAFSKEDGIELSASGNFLANTYDVFLFPTYFLVGDYMNDLFFLIGLLFNCLFYSFLIETIIVLRKAFQLKIQLPQ